MAGYSISDFTRVLSWDEDTKILVTYAALKAAPEATKSYETTKLETTIWFTSLGKNPGE